MTAKRKQIIYRRTASQKVFLDFLFFPKHLCEEKCFPFVYIRHVNEIVLFSKPLPFIPNLDSRSSNKNSCSAAKSVHSSRVVRSGSIQLTNRHGKLESAITPPSLPRVFVSISSLVHFQGVTSDSSKFHVLAIHRVPELIHETIKLINQEWPRSFGARLHSLESSKDSLPTCLVLTKSKSDHKSAGEDENQSVFAHLKLTPIPSLPFACFIESVVVWKSLRGQGIGSYFMNEAEKYCKFNLNLEVIYLTTTDKQDFYKKLGYEVCEPVSIFGGPCNGVFKPLTKKTFMKKVIVDVSDDEQC